MILKSQKVPTIQLSSYLLGLTNKTIKDKAILNNENFIENKEEPEIKERVYNEKQERIQTFVRKMKAKKRIVNYIKGTKVDQTDEVELPQVEKKLDKE